MFLFIAERRELSALQSFIFYKEMRLRRVCSTTSRYTRTQQPLCMAYYPLLTMADGRLINLRPCSRYARNEYKRGAARVFTGASAFYYLYMR